VAAATSKTRPPRTRPRLGIALGSGSARGWAHIGVLRALGDAGIEPDVVCGTSIGALVGAAYVTGQLDALERWARSIRWFDIVRLMDVTLARGGFIEGARLFEALRSRHSEVHIEALPKPFAAVATDFASGREVWLQHGPLIDAVRASASLPGLFPPVPSADGWLVDGGLVNPVPVSVCRALGAEVVVAINLNSDLTARNAPPRLSRRRLELSGAVAGATKLSARLREQLRGTTSRLATSLRSNKQDTPSLIEVLAGALYIMQDRITRSRMAGDPAEVVLTPRLGGIRLLDFDRADEAIAAGYACVTAMLPVLQPALATPPER